MVSALETLIAPNSNVRHKHLDSSHNRSIDCLVFVWKVSRNPDTVLKESVLQACGFPAEKSVFLTRQGLLELRIVTPRQSCEER